MTSHIDIDELIVKKREILERKKRIPRENLEEIKEVEKEYFRIQKKIQYYSDEEHRLNKITSTMERNKANRELYNQYQRSYQALKKANSVF